jgi:hypothetical protein
MGLVPLIQWVDVTLCECSTYCVRAVCGSLFALRQVLLSPDGPCSVGLRQVDVTVPECSTYCICVVCILPCFRYFFRQIVAGLDYCHTHHIAHRDLKLANFLLSTDKPMR